MLNLNDLKELTNATSSDGEQWVGHCIVDSHEDKNPSFSFTQQNGKLLYHCYAGCSQKEIIDSIRTKYFQKAFGKPSPVCNFKAKTFPTLMPLTPSASPTRILEKEFIYLDHLGNKRLRITRLDDPSGKKTFRQSHWNEGVWKNGKGKGQIAPYKYSKWKDSTEPIFVVEGEKCVLSCESIGLPATTTPGGSNSWTSSFSSYFVGRTVYILPDEDEPGRKYASQIFLNLSPIASVRIIKLPNLLKGDDICDWISRGGTKDKLLEICNSYTFNNEFDKLIKELNKEPELIEMSDVEASDPIFLDRPYILGDAVTLLGGDGGGGKSQITLDYAARVSQEKNVCIFSNEDKPGTIKKRLSNQDAVMSRVHLCNKAFDLSSEEGQRLAINFIFQKKPGLVIIDSLASYSGNKDLNKSTDVRQIINFLNLTARRFQSAIIVILHLNKGDGKSIYKISGSTQLVAAARSVLVAGCKPGSNYDEESIGALFHIKANESKKGKAKGYTLTNEGLRWTETTLKFSDIMASDSDSGKGTPALDEAEGFLQDTLSNGAKKIKDVKVEAEEMGIAPATLRRAKEILGIRVFKVTEGTGRGRCSGYWKLSNCAK